MLARRIIPCLDVAGGRVVKGVHFTALRDAGDPVEQATRYDAEGADELVFLDISASPEARQTTLEMVGRVAYRAVQIHGGMGLVRGYPVERFYRDIRHYRVGEGSSEIQRMLIAREVLR